MGLWNWIQTQVTGIDLAAEQQRANASDALLTSLNTAPDYLDRLSPEKQAVVQSHLADNYSQSANLSGQVNDAFIEGAAQGLQNEINFVHDGLNAVGGTIWRAIPLWVWFLGVVALFIYLGGEGVIRRQLAKL